MPGLYMTTDERKQMAHLLRRQRDAAIGMAAVCETAETLYRLVHECLHTDTPIKNDSVRATIATLYDRLMSLDSDHDLPRPSIPR